VRFLHFNFLPRSTDLALLVLRVWFGASMAALHGWGKLTGFSAMSGRFVDPFGIGRPATLALATFGELVCASLLVLGLFTRFAALVLAITMTAAFWYGHGARLTGAGNGELPFIYLGGFLALFVAGGGRFSLDAKIGAKV
jgi:putative oxidoreductase